MGIHQCMMHDYSFSWILYIYIYIYIYIYYLWSVHFLFSHEFNVPKLLYFESYHGHGICASFYENGLNSFLDFIWVII